MKEKTNRPQFSDPSPNLPRRVLRRLLNLILFYPIALILLFEEWGWEPLADFFSRLSRLPAIAKLEMKIVQLPPWGVLILFFIPMIGLLPLKLLALAIFAKGHVVSGTLLLIGAKLFGTAFFARIFQLTQPVLMRIRLFALWYPRWKSWKDNLLRQFRSTFAWHVMQETKSRLKKWWTTIRQKRA